MDDEPKVPISMEVGTKVVMWRLREGAPEEEKVFIGKPGIVVTASIRHVLVKLDEEIQYKESTVDSFIADPHDLERRN